MRDFRRSVLAVDAAAAAVLGLLDGGKILVFDGQKPPDPDAPQNQEPIAQLHFGSPAFRVPVAGRAEAGDVGPDLQVQRAGRPTWFRAVTSAGAPVFDGTVGCRGRGEEERYDLELDSPDVELDATVRVEQLTYVEAQRGPRGGHD